MRCNAGHGTHIWHIFTAMNSDRSLLASADSVVRNVRFLSSRYVYKLLVPVAHFVFHNHSSDVVHPCLLGFHGFRWLVG